jgi:hypothetical protein
MLYPVLGDARAYLLDAVYPRVHGLRIGTECRALGERDTAL